MFIGIGFSAQTILFIVVSCYYFDLIITLVWMSMKVPFCLLYIVQGVSPQAMKLSQIALQELSES